MLQCQYLGRIDLEQALKVQQETLQKSLRGGGGAVLGFELEPVVTLGVRAHADEVSEAAAPPLRRAGFAIERVDRGGQATLHNPGQLVIFPVVPVGDLGPRAWVCRLIKTTQKMATGLQQELRWDELSPGLYDDFGKVVSIGVRLRQGVSTHGLAINVHNDLVPFSWIRACGRASAPMSRLRTELTLSEVFGLWCEAFKAEVDKCTNLVDFRASFQEVRS